MRQTLIKLCLLFPCTEAFSISRMPRTLFANTHLKAQETQVTASTEETESKVSTFLKFIGPYPALALRFPDLATPSQRERDVSGISLDFIIDTAANTNTINGKIAEELDCESVGSALPGYGSAGAIAGGETFLLGNCTLDLPDQELFMTDLTASALPVASPAAAGLLGVGFLNCFEGGVEFEWGGGIDARQPMVTFHGEKSGIEEQLKGMRRVPIEVIDQILLPSVILRINGAEIPALLDTGSPVTVLNSVAANLAGLSTIELESDKQSEESGGFNPFKKMTDNFKAAQSMAEAASKGDILVMAGADGQRIDLRRTKEKAQITLGLEGQVSFPSTYIYVGDLPGLKALESLGGSSSPPAAVLGMDVLKKLPIMIYRGMQKEVYF